jgi:hypothetical protein
MELNKRAHFDQSRSLLSVPNRFTLIINCCFSIDLAFKSLLQYSNRFAGQLVILTINSHCLHRALNSSGKYWSSQMLRSIRYFTLALNRFEAPIEQVIFIRETERMNFTKAPLITPFS